MHGILGGGISGLRRRADAQVSPPLQREDLEGACAASLDGRARAFRALSLLVFAIVLLVGARKFRSYQDDAFIFFRYADNFAHGLGLVFNRGERVEGFTSPLWMGLLALATRLGIAPTLIAGILGTLSAGLTVLVSVSDARRCGPPGGFAVLAPVALAMWAPLVLWAVSGLETCLFTCLLWASWAMFRASIASSRPPGLALGMMLAAATLARPEGALAVAAIGANVASARKPRPTLLVLAPTFVSGATLLVARWLYFRDVLPNTFYAKLGGTPRHYVLGAAYVWHFLRGAPLVWFLPALLLRPRSSRIPALGALLAFFAMWTLNVVRTGGDYFPYSRFMVPIAPAAFALAAHGAHRAYLWLGDALDTGPRSARGSAWLARTAPLAILAALLGLQYEPTAIPVQHGLEWTTRWGKLGRTLARVLPPGAAVAAPNIGAVGYYSKLPIVDLLGLVDRAIAHRASPIPEQILNAYDIGHETFDVELSMRRKPQVIVFMHALSSEPFTDPSEIPADTHVERRLLDRLAHDPEYRLMNLLTEPRQYWGIFIRRDLVLPAPAG